MIDFSQMPEYSNVSNSVLISFVCLSSVLSGSFSLDVAVVTNASTDFFSISTSGLSDATGLVTELSARLPGFYTVESDATSISVFSYDRSA